MEQSTQNVQELEHQKMTLIHGLSQAAISLRGAADLAEGFANLLTQSPFAPHAIALPNQYTNMLGNASKQLQLNLPNENHATPTRKKGARASPTEDDGKKKRKKTEKKIKDPNAPKRPPSAYLLFQNEVRKEMQALFPDKPYHEVLSEISKKWSSLPDEEKAVYNQATSEAKDRFKVTKAAYDLQKAEDGTAAADAVPAPVATTPVEPLKVAKATAKVAPVVPAAPAAATDSSEEESDPSSEEEEEEEDEEEQQPPSKKAKTSTPSSKSRKKVKV